jgi:hypothetical protein
MPDTGVREGERLAMLVGRWKTEGWTTGGRGARSARIDAWDTYEWLPGLALLHRVDAVVGDQKIEGAEIIGFDPSRGSYATLYFGNDGPTAYEANFAETDGRTIWEMRSDLTRFTGTFGADGDTITGHWEQRKQGGSWQAWMEITLTKQ